MLLDIGPFGLPDVLHDRISIFHFRPSKIFSRANQPAIVSNGFNSFTPNDEKSLTLRVTTVSE